MIRTYQAEHGGMVFEKTLSRRQKKMRTRIMAMAVIATIAASAGMVQAMHDRSVFERAYASNTWVP
ncbi:hypothetical protein [Caulobacter sp.]|uniref:hypothetical protein n=1 Tax=Caulobacter sp. TaxID=78 RepID=UPI00161CE258